MGYSSLATVKIWSPNNSGRRTHTIDSVAIHCMAGNLSAQGCGDLFSSPSREASSNYGIGSDGTIGVYVDEDNRAWCTSNSGVDNRAISIEVANTSASEPFPCSDAAYESLIKLLVDICRRNNITALRWKNDQNYANAAANGGPVTEQNMFVHRWFAYKSCPGEWLFERQGQIATEVNRRLGNGESYASTVAKTVIFIGDSRTVQMKAAVGEDNNIWSCKGAMGLAWMKSTGVPAIESKIGPSTSVCILMGINDMIYISAEDYAEYINSKAAVWLTKGASVYFVSVNPVSRLGYGIITNQKIEVFNQKVRSLLMNGVGYIDTYNQIIDNFVAPDGLHYDNTTYKNIYNVVLAQACSGTVGYNAGVAIMIDHTKFNPYLVKLSRSATSVPYSKLSDNKIVGAIVEAGRLYSENGVKLDAFDNPNLESQVRGLDEAGVPYGLYVVCKARHSVDAKEEMYKFSFPIRRHPPKLGVWLQLELDLTLSQSITTKILERYRDDLTRLGFLGKIGIMCTRSQLKAIDWKKFQDDFYLWLIDKVSDVSEFDKLMDPEFFDTDGE